MNSFGGLELLVVVGFVGIIAIVIRKMLISRDIKLPENIPKNGIALIVERCGEIKKDKFNYPGRVLILEKNTSPVINNLFSLITLIPVFLPQIRIFEDKIIFQRPLKTIEKKFSEIEKIAVEKNKWDKALYFFPKKFDKIPGITIKNQKTFENLVDFFGKKAKVIEISEVLEKEFGGERKVLKEIFGNR